MAVGMHTMKTITFFVISIFGESCQHNETKIELKLPEQNEYNNIICEIIKQDTATFKYMEQIKAPISAHLQTVNIHLYISHDTNQTSSLFDIGTSVINLMARRLTTPITFKLDSLYFAFQNGTPDTIFIKNTCGYPFFLSESETKKRMPLKGMSKIELVKKMKHQDFKYVRFTRPILNYNKTKAFVYMNDDYTENTCRANDQRYLLEKINGHWKLNQHEYFTSSSTPFP